MRETSRNVRGQPSFGAFARKPGERLSTAKDAAVDAAQRVGVEDARSWPADAAEVGAVVDAYGLGGWVKVAAHARAERGGNTLLRAKCWWLCKKAERRIVDVVQAKLHGDTVVAQLAGVTDRDAALLLRGYCVHVRRADFPSLKADEFYWVDLLDLDVVNEAGVALGQVASMFDNGAHAIMRVEYSAPNQHGELKISERLIPFVGAYVKTVDQAARRIIVAWGVDY